MKIWNNNGNVVHVQLKDIYIMYYNGEEIPQSVFDKVFRNDKISNKNLENFVRFDTKEEMAFFLKHDWIINWNYYSESSEDELLNDIDIYTNISSGLKSRLMNGNLDSEEAKDLSIELTHLLHKICAFNNILDYKREKVEIPFPLECSEYGLLFYGNTYKICKAIDPKKLLICRIDGKKLTYRDRITKNFINTGISIDVMDGNNTDYLDGKTTVELELSSDNKYLIIKYVPNKEYIDNEELRDNNKSGLGRLLNRIVKR